MALTERAQSMDSHGDVDGDTRLEVVALRWLRQLEVAPRTVDGYKQVWNTHLAKALGGLRLKEVGVQRLQVVLDSISQRSSPYVAKQARIVLTQVFAVATRLDAIDRNPALSTKPVRLPKTEPQALSLEQVAALRKQLREFDARPGWHACDLADATDLLLATGMRTGECLGLQWVDVDLLHGTVAVTGQLVDRAGGLERQDYPKTPSGFRRMHIGAGVVAMLERRLAERQTAYVFPSSHGTLWSPHNFRRTWRDFRKAYDVPEWVTPKTARKTVATLLRDSIDIEAASLQLGHSTSAVTSAHYAEKVKQVPDFTAVLDRLTA
jgi:integrase